MKAIFKNFIFILKKFKTSSFLNILGLSVAMAVFIVCMIQVFSDFTYNHNFKNINNTYLFTQYSTISPNDTYAPWISTPRAKEMSEKFPEIRNYCLYISNANSNFDIIQKNGEKMSIEANLIKTTKGFINIFSPQIITGNPAEVFIGEKTSKAMLTESTAKTLFGDESAIGKSFFFHNSTEPITVTAICKDFPKNCFVPNGVFVLLPDDIPENSNYFGYFDIAPENVEKLEKRLNSAEFYGENTMKQFKADPENASSASLIPLNRIHLHFPMVGSGNFNSTVSLLAIGIAILIMAYINYINFSIAIAPARIKSLNIQKILGAKNKTLRSVIIFEAVLFSLIAYSFALLCVELFKDTTIVKSLFTDISVSYNKVLLVFTGIIILFCGILFGLYPAYYVTSFSPAIAIKNSFASSKRSLKLKNTLICIQFISSVTLISIAAFIYIQYNYVTNYSWGIQKENIVYMRTYGLKTDIDTFGKELIRNKDISDYTIAGFLPGSVGMGWDRDFEGKIISVMSWPVGRNFLEFFGVPVVQGRNFTDTEESDIPYIIVNQAFMNKYRFEDILGKKIFCFDGDGEIIGVAKNVNFESLHNPIRPMIFVRLNSGWNNIILLKISGNNIDNTFNYIKQCWNKYNDEVFDCKFLDTRLDNLYKKENNLAQVILICSIITIMIAIMGVYGLIVFNTKYRSKEIAIRKVNGSSVFSIVLLLNRNIFGMLILAFCIATPLAYYIVQQWLDSFAYKTPVYWWVFATSGILVFLTTIATTCWQSIKAARKNPINYLKSE